MANALAWMDVPVLDLDRAIKFYAAVLAGEVKRQEFNGMQFALLPHYDSGVSGCLYKKDDEKPCDRGIVVYLNVQGRLDEAIAAVSAHGGKIVIPKHSIGPHGFRAIILVSEGNRLALHST